MRHISEFTQLITPDGTTFNFDAQDKFLISETGYGMPPINYITQKGPYQHGETVIDYRLQPRTIQLVHRHNACSRTDFYNNRATLLNMLRPNRQTSGTLTPSTLRKILPDGSRRDLKVVISQGPEFVASQQGQWDEWSFMETLRFTAYDPIFYEPTQQSTTLTVGTPINLWEFPLEFPSPMGRNFVFGNPSTAGHYTTIAYTGTWLTYPGFVLTGPMDGPTIKNYSTGETIALLYNLSNGETLTINLDYGVKSVTSDIAGNVLWCVKDASDFSTFHLAPTPEASGGNNVILVDAGNWKTGVSSIAISYYRRYIGL